MNATDADAGANGEVECTAPSYSQVQSALQVSSDCRVTLRAGVLDRETQAQHRLAVIVRDRGTSTPLLYFTLYSTTQHSS